MDQWLTPTAVLADYVLPAANWLEMPTLMLTFVTGMNPFVAAGEAAVSPLYERKLDYELWRGLGLRLGQEKCWRSTIEEEYEWSLGPLLKKLELKSYQEFVEKQRYWGPPMVEKRYEQVDSATGKPKGFATPTGKVELSSAILEKLGYDSLPSYVEPPETPISDPELAKEYPLILITGSNYRPFHHSEHRQIPSLRKLYPYPTVLIHPNTARRHRIAEGDWVIIETKRGRIKQRAAFTTAIHHRVIDVQHGWWFPEEIPDDPILYRIFESNANILTSEDEKHVDPAIGAPYVTGLLCKIYPVKKYY